MSQPTQDKFQLAENAWKLDQFRSVIEFYEEALIARPDLATSPIFTRIGFCHMEFLEYKSALNAFNEAIEMDNFCVNALINRSYVNLKLGNLSGSMADATLAISLDPNSHGGYVRRAQVFQEQGHYLAELKDREKIVKLAPEAAVSVWNLGLVLGKIGRFQEAILNMQKAKKLYENSKDKQACDDQITVYERKILDVKQKYKKGLQALNTALQNTPLDKPANDTKDEHPKTSEPLKSENAKSENAKVDKDITSAAVGAIVTIPSSSDDDFVQVVSDSAVMSKNVDIH